MARRDVPGPDNALDGIPCPFCGYDLRVQVVEDSRARRWVSRCPECGEDVQHEQIIDCLPLLCEGRTPLAAFFLVPIDLLHLLWPRLRLADRRRLSPSRQRARRVLLMALPVWLITAASLFLFIAFLAKVTLLPGCEPERADPLTRTALANAGTFAVTGRDIPVCAGIFLSAFLIALGVLIIGLRRLRPSGPRGQVQFMHAHALRRTLFVISPVFWGLILSAALSLLFMILESNAFEASKGTPASCCMYTFIPAAFLWRLARAGYQDGAGQGAAVYTSIGLLAIGAWVLWISVLGGLLMQRNLAQVLHVLNVW